MNLNEIFNNKGNKQYYIHRFSIAPLFINFNINKNNMPVLLSMEEFSKLEDDENVFLLPFDFWTSEDNEDEKEEIAFLKEHGISKEMYEEKAKVSFEEGLKKFFKRGLYVVETSIERTATSLKDDPEIEFSKLAKKPNFSFNAGNNFLGTLANREDDINAVIILEIPKECVEGISPLFEKVDEVLTILTTYRGVIETDTVIPRQYIKGAIVKKGEDFIYYDNSEYDATYKVVNGKHDDKSLDKLIDKTSRTPFDYDTTLAIFEAIDKDFAFSGDIYSFRSKTKALIDMMQQGAERTEKNRELYYKIARRINEVRKSTMTPLEKEVEDLDLSNLTEEEITLKAKNILLKGSETLAEDRSKYAIGFGERVSLFRDTLLMFDDSILAKIDDKKVVEEIQARKEQTTNLSRLSYEILWIDSEFQCGRSEDVDLKKRYEEAKKEYEIVYEALMKKHGSKEI